MMRFSSERVSTALFVTAIFLLISGFAGQCLKYGMGITSLYGLVPLFDLGREGNLPTFFSSMLLMISGVLLALIASAERRRNSPFSGRWKLLSAGFFYLSMDEAAHIHEILQRPFQELLGEYAMGYLYFAWVIPGIAAACVVAVLYIRFLAALAPVYRNAFLLAGALYLSGAIGVEMLDGKYATVYGMNFGYAVLVTVEEGLEMAGAILFIGSLLSYLQTYVPSTTIEFFSKRRDSLQARRIAPAALELQPATPRLLSTRGLPAYQIRGRAPLVRTPAFFRPSGRNSRREQEPISFVMKASTMAEGFPSTLTQGPAGKNSPGDL